ncbi:MAG: HPr family phosphocarrier protein [Elusimicrobiales bacterium]
MVSETVKVVNPLGMHARPAAALVATASQFASEIKISRNGDVINGKSVMGVMMLAAECGSALTVSVSGPDENAALSAIRELFARGFDEMEADKP